jgi:ABC-2 type transport system permease protein
MSAAGLLVRQVRYTNKAFWRNPASAFFTFAFPLLFLVIFTSLIQGQTVVNGVVYDNATYFTSSMGAFGVISACYTNIAISIVFSRDEGVLKRLRGTPMPGGVFLSARVLHAMLVALVLVLITIAFGVARFGIDLPSGSFLAKYMVSLVVGAGCFAALGLAVSGIVPNADAGPPIVNAIILPLLFLSGVFIPIGDDAPAWVKFVGDVFPVRHFFDATRDAFLQSPGFSWGDVGVVALWLVAAVVLATRTFRWESRR